MNTKACRSTFFRVTVLATLFWLLSLFLGNVTAPQEVHAATSTPTLTLSDSTVHPYQKITVSVQGFAPNDTVTLSVGVNGYEVAKLTCDSNGNASSEITIPFMGPQGQYTLDAVGAQQGETIATATYTSNPVLLFDGGWAADWNAVHKGGPDTYTELNGYSFQPNETINIYWGEVSNTPLSTVTTDDGGSFHFSFTIPSGLVPGKYKVLAIRTNQNPALVSTTFTLLPPSLSGPGGVRSGHLLNLNGQGFQSTENVALSWDANGGQLLKVVQASTNGSIGPLDNLYTPSAPDGTYTITAKGETSGLQATLSINVGPGLTTNTPINAGGVLSITGGGFSANEAINVYVVGHKSVSVVVTSAADGSFQTSLTIPVSLGYNVTYHVAAQNSDGSERAETFFNVMQPQLSWSGTDQSDKAYYGTLSTLEGLSFPANEQVTLYWNYQQAGQIAVGTATAAADGSFSFNFTTPSSPAGTVTIEAIAETTSYNASYQVQTGAAIYLDHPIAQLGQTIAVNGGDFAPNTSITVSMLVDYTTVTTTTTTDSTGAFTTSLTLPSDEGGSATVDASDGTITAHTPLVIQVPISLTPNTGSGGTSITVQAPNLNISSGNCGPYEPTIDWYDPVTGKSQVLTSFCPNGHPFITTVTAPASLVSGQTYQIEVFIGKNLMGEAPFTAQ